MKKKPTDVELLNARAEFRELLSRATPEPTWQSFFSENPFVLSRALPLRLQPCDILPLGRPGRDEPDFLIYPGSELSLPVHGLIELKKNSSRITTVPRKNLLALSRTASTAIRQLENGDRQYDILSPVKRCLSFGNASYLFVVMGIRQEIVQLSANPAFLTQLSEIFPPNIRFLCFDELLKTYEAGLPLRSYVLVRDGFRREELSSADIDASQQQIDGFPMVKISAHFYRPTPAQFSTVQLDNVLSAEEQALKLREIWTLNRDVYAAEGPYLTRAPFERPNPGDLRLGNPVGVFYAADNVETALAEHSYLGGPFSRSVGDGLDTSLIMHRFRVTSTLHDLRSLDRDAAANFDPANYVPMKLSAQLRRRGSNGLIYRSVRGSGTIAALFSPIGVSHAAVVSRIDFLHSRDGNAVVHRTG